MSLHRPSALRSNHPLAMELGLVVAVLVGVALWERVVRGLSGLLRVVLGPAATLTLSSLVTTVLFLAGLVALAGAYATARNDDVGLSLPTRADTPAITLAVFAPVVLVGITALVGTHTGVPYSTLAESYYTGESQLELLAIVAGLGLLLSVPSLVVIAQVVVQRSLERALEGDHVALVTTLVAGFLLTETTTGGLNPIPEFGKLVGAAAVVLALLATRYVSERVDADLTRHVEHLPVLLFVVFVVLSAGAEVDSVAGACYALVPFAVVGVAAFGYDRSGSLLVPALAYLAASIAETAVLVLEAGVRLP